MTRNGPMVMQTRLAIDPLERQRARNGGEWRIWLGWAAAALLHGGLLLALIYSWPAHLYPDKPSTAPVSLLIVAVQPASSNAVRPKPSATPAIVPGPTPVKIAPIAQALTSRPRLSSPGKTADRPPKPPAAPAPRGVVEPRPVAQQDGDGFVAAQPEEGDINQPPEYPAQAQLHGEQGDVLLSIHVLADGRPDSVSVTQSSGYAILDAAAAQAVWRWRFQPSTLAGQKVPSVIPYRIHFNLQSP